MNIGFTSSSTLTLLRFSSAVWPWLKGAGWLTRCCSSIRTVSLPWVTAAGPTRTAELITTVPVRALTMTFAGGSARGDVEILDHAHQRRAGFEARVGADLRR